MKNFLTKLKNILFFDPKAGTKGQFCLHWLINLAFLGLWCLGCSLVGLYFAKAGYGPELFFSYLSRKSILALNLLPGCMVALLFLFISGRIWPSVLSSGLFTLSVALVNHYKLMLRGEPLLVSDISHMAEAAQISGGYSFSISPALVLTAAAFILAMVLACLFMRAKIKKALVRIGGSILVLALCAGLYTTVYTSDAMYNRTENLGVNFAAGYSLNQWKEADQYRSRGFMYPFIHSAKDAFGSKPEGYDRRDAEELLSSLPGGDIPENEKVNIISIMLEAYCDLSIYESVLPGDTDAYGYFHDLQEESFHGSLVTNIFAGGTIDTERAFLSGSTIMYEYRSSADSYARYFAEQGYRTEFCHPGYEWFYNRRNVMEYLGFDRSYFHEDRYNIDGAHAMDDVLFPDILSLYKESKAAGEPYFNFSVSYQNHGPYATDTLNDPGHLFAAQGELSDSSHIILNNYLDGIYRTGQELEKMVDTLRADSEPVILVLFGDHKPWLGDDSFVYAELGIELSLSDSESFYNFYETPYLIWANDAAREILGSEFRGEGPDISPCFLMMQLFDLAGWEGDGYMQALRELCESVPVVNDAGIYLINGKTTGYIDGENLEKLKTVEYLQYYRMHDWN